MYIIQEIQTNGLQTDLVPAVRYGNRNQAESAYHQALTAAAISSVEVHTVMMYDEHGNVIRKEYYEHGGG